MNLSLVFAILFAIFYFHPAMADQASAAKAVGPVVAQDVGAWLRKLNASSQRKAYTGTFVVSTAGSMSSARIWHVCDGEQQVERVDTLTGPARSTLRRNDEVVTFLPDTQVALLERRDALSLFPALLQPGDQAVGDFYTLRPLTASDRVAGLLTDVHELVPRDDWRFGYRVWSDRKTGLVLKLQTLDPERRVLEQVAFSELNMGAPVKAEQLLGMMNNRSGYTVHNLTTVRTTPLEQGWRLKQPLPGFSSSGCHVRTFSTWADQKNAPMQCVFSDGLASISVFVEVFDASRHMGSGQMASGATQSLSRRVGDHWVTFVGEVPAKTLAWFAHSLERTR